MTSYRKIANLTTSLMRWKMSFSHLCACKLLALNKSQLQKCLSHRKMLREMLAERTSPRGSLIALVQRNKRKRKGKIRMIIVESPT